MKYVNLEYRLYVPAWTLAFHFVDFDTNDKEFDSLATKQSLKQYNAHKTTIKEIQKKADAESQQMDQIDNEINQLKNNTSIFKRIFSKEYKSKIKSLEDHHYYHFDQHRKTLKEIEKVNDYENRAYAEYHDLKKLLKESGYILTNKSTDNDLDITTEIWHKN